MKGTRATVTSLVVSAILLMSAAPGYGQPQKGSFWYVIDNITETTDAAEAVIWVTVPPVWYGQEVTLGRITPEPTAIVEDADSGNRILEWRLRPGARSLEPTGMPWQQYFHYDFELNQIAVRRHGARVAQAPYDKTAPEYQFYTKQEPGIQTGGRILDLAREIAGSETDPYSLGRRFYGWILDNMTFKPNSRTSWDAMSILTDRQGNCDQFSTLFVALCRSVGIPSRTVANTWTWGGRHVFAEILVPGEGWLPVDSSLGQLLTAGRGGLSEKEVEEILGERGIPLGDAGWTFGNLFANRLIISLGKNMTFHSPTLGRDITLQTMMPGGTDAHPDGFRLTGYNKDVVHGGFYVFDEELSEDAAHALAHQRLAKYFFKTDVDDDGEGGCRSFSSSNAGGVQRWINLGKSHLHKGDYYKAEAAFQRALRLEHEHSGENKNLTVWLHNYLGNCYDLLDQREMALQQYRKALTFQNNFKGAEVYANRYLAKPFTR